MKKFLAVATALVLAISSLCVFVVADDSEATVVAEQTSTGTLTILSGVDFTDDSLYLYINYTLDDSSYVGWAPGAICDSGWTGIVSFTADSTGLYSISLVDLAAEFTAAGVDVSNGVVLNWWGSYATLVSVQLVSVGSSSSSSSDTTVSSQTSTGTLTILDGVDFTDENLYLYINYSLDDSSYAGWAPGALCDTSWTGILNITADSTGLYTISLVDLAAAFTSEGGDASNGVILNWWGSSYATLISVDLVSKGTDSSTQVQTSSSRNQGVIYINEEYHGIFVTRTIGTTTRKYLVNVPHTVDSTGYCTVCCMYIGSDEEAGTATIDGVEYEEVYSVDVNLASSDWGTYEFADNSIIDALANDGALLVITRSEATDIVYDDDAGTYEKLGLVDSWWVGDWIRLGTAGHTDADEEAETIIDCMSDDGTTIIYDGATVYAAWESAGMNNGGTATLITNTSGTYTITNVAVYVPSGTVTAEDVDVTEPAEPTDTETEDDGTDDVEVTENDTTADTNPTTGVVLALVPMAIAGFAAVASKRK